jgi:hypothetical protein
MHANLKFPDGIRLIYLPPYTPELQPAETLWALIDEPIINKHIATLTELDEKIAAQCIALAEQPEQIQGRDRIPLVAKSNRSALISRKWYELGPCGSTYRFHVPSLPAPGGVLEIHLKSGTSAALSRCE